ncbi:hypothetical protein [Pyruvatibacter mobilis]|uniref:hypothetical protein n=1 Tax=Pyruvatibacter mobilis TaxID=1712261 RepID=UPI003BACFA28
MASNLSSARTSAQSASILDRAAQAVKSTKAGDMVVNALWAVLAVYGLAATVNVFLTY